jgi:hypothetical protein
MKVGEYPDWQSGYQLLEDLDLWSLLFEFQYFVGLSQFVRLRFARLHIHSPFSYHISPQSTAMGGILIYPSRKYTCISNGTHTHLA